MVEGHAWTELADGDEFADYRIERRFLKEPEKEDMAAYLEARATRNYTEEERQHLAEAVGFHVCSNSEA